MKLKLQPAALCLAAALSFGLSACGSSDDAASDAAGSDVAGTAGEASSESVVGKMKAAVAPASAPKLADGPDVCFRAIAKHLGADVKVAEISSFFSAGSEIDGNADNPEGEMTTCTVNYQNPEDPRKLLSTRMDISTGEFAPPSQVEISVSGNAADFRLEDHLVALSAINPAALTGVMEEQKAKLASVFSRHAWTGVRLSGPSAFSRTHTLRLDGEGRLAANDIKESGYASVSLDGKTITKNHLMP